MADDDDMPPLVDVDSDDNDNETVSSTTTTVTSSSATVSSKGVVAAASSTTSTTTTNEDGTTSKKTDSKYYFFKSTPAHLAEQYRPQLIQPGTVINTSPSPTPVDGPSQWNAAGTWEDRDMSSWACSRVKEIFSGAEVKDKSSGVIVTIKSVSKAEGDATIIFSRGEYKSDTVEGTLEFVLDDTNGDDYDINVNCKDGTIAEKAVRTAAKLLLPEIRKRAQEFVTEFKKQ